MKAVHSRFLKLLQGEKQFKIPIYQRTYDWETENCQQLLDDIIKVANDENRPTHFFGSIVYMEPEITNQTDVDQLLVIDGQQRLTTIALLLFVIHQIFLGRPNPDPGNVLSRIRKLYLINPDVADKNKKYKLILTKSDTETLNNIIAGTPDTGESAHNITKNLNFFKKSIEDNDLDIEMLYAGLRKLNIVDLSLEKDSDNPQLIFESLNSTGLKLTEADKIRNFLLMGLDEVEQNDLYEKFWYPMERNLLSPSNRSKIFDRFMKDYLTIKQTIIPATDKVYFKFREYHRDENMSNAEHVKDLHYYSEFFEVVALEKTPDKEIKAAVSDINELRVKPTYPFLMQVLSDYKKKIISKADVLEITDLIQSYIFRRQHTPGTETHGHDITFSTLYNMIEKKDYVDSIKATLLSKQGDHRFPTDTEFLDGLSLSNVYEMKSCEYLLLKLENSLRKKDKENMSDVTIEHIMPQEIKKIQEWKDDLGPHWEEIQIKYLHRLGNLTITQLNSEMGNKPFQEKKEIAFNSTPFYLSKDLKQLKHWNKAEIEKRHTELVDMALEVWKYPTVSNESLLQKYKTMQESSSHIATIEDDEDPIAIDGWNHCRNKASDENIKIQNELIKKIHEKFDCISSPHQWWMYFHVKEPAIRRNRFMVMSCSIDSFMVMYQIHPETYVDNDNLTDRKGNPKIRSLKSSWFFRGAEKPTECRILVDSADDLPLVLEQLEHAYQITKDQKNYKTKSY